MFYSSIKPLHKLKTDVESWNTVLSYRATLACNVGLCLSVATRPSFIILWLPVLLRYWSISIYILSVIWLYKTRARTLPACGATNRIDPRILDFRG